MEVGSWTGRSTRFWAGLAPQATVIAIDHWQGRPKQRADPELAEFPPQLHETFLSECWNYRDRIIPVKADMVDGLQHVADAGLDADLVWIDAEHDYESVEKHLSTALDLFPRAILVGEDLDCEGVQRAVETVTRQRGISYETFGIGCVLAGRA